jgi:hypothetical protein
MRERHEQDAANDRPYDWERMASDGDDQKLGQVKHACDPSPQKCAKKPKEDRQNETAAGPTTQPPRNCATDSSDNEVYDELEHGHANRQSNDGAVLAFLPARDTGCRGFASNRPHLLHIRLHIRSGTTERCTRDCLPKAMTGDYRSQFVALRQLRDRLFRVPRRRISVTLAVCDAAPIPSVVVPHQSVPAGKSS